MRGLVRWLRHGFIGRRFRELRFPGSAGYWETRYSLGGTSGAGSYGEAAAWKAQIVNDWVETLGVQSVVDWGCGDGSQLALARYPRYLGTDRSPTAVRLCIARFREDATKSFLAYDPATLHDPAGWLAADLALSLEVIFHLTEEEIFHDYMRRLFASAERYVIICSNDSEGTELGPSERHWRFTDWITRHEPEWTLVQHESPPEYVDLISQLYLFARNT